MTHELDSETLTSDTREPVGKGDSIQKHLRPEGGARGGIRSNMSQKIKIAKIGKLIFHSFQLIVHPSDKFGYF